jgi:predicted mannosyl-3-phosphoglycerate phosphatase (HAD superfamily)
MDSKKQDRKGLWALSTPEESTSIKSDLVPTEDADATYTALSAELDALRETLREWSDTIDDAKHFRYWVDELETAVGIPPEIRSIATLRVKREYLEKALGSYLRGSRVASGVLGKKLNDQARDARSAIEKIDREIASLRQEVPKNESKS